MEIRELIEKIVKEMEEKGGLKNVVWVAAGGSNDGHYAAQYFMDRESTAVRSQMITSSEFEFAAPKCIGENTKPIENICKHGAAPTALAFCDE